MSYISLMKHTFFQEAKIENQLAEFITNETRLSMGDKVFQFERQFADWHNRKHCIMVNSGSSANLVLLTALLNLGILSKGDRVALSGVTWSTNVMPVIQLGLNPVLMDVLPDCINVGLDSLIPLNNIRAVFVTNVLGLENDIKNIRQYCLDNDIILLEDNCEGLGCKTDELLLGNYSLASGELICGTSLINNRRWLCFY